MLAKLRELDTVYSDRAYVFVLAALEYCQKKRTIRSHISGEELAWATRDLAREQFGLTARTVLEHWGIVSTADIGRIVFKLIDAGLLIRGAQDRIEDFDAVFDFDAALESDYPWMGVLRSTRANYPGAEHNSQS